MASIFVYKGISFQCEDKGYEKAHKKGVCIPVSMCHNPEPSHYQPMTSEIRLLVTKILFWIYINLLTYGRSFEIILGSLSYVLLLVWFSNLYYGI